MPDITPNNEGVEPQEVRYSEFDGAPLSPSYPQSAERHLMSRDAFDRQDPDLVPGWKRAGFPTEAEYNKAVKAVADSGEVKRGEAFTVVAPEPVMSATSHAALTGLLDNVAVVQFGGKAAREAIPFVTTEELAKALLERVLPGWDHGNPHAKDTPRRFVASLTELCTRSEEWNFTTFPAQSDEMIVLGPIPFYTLCAHHVVPFHGNMWIGYVPNQLIAGLSKFVRAVQYCSKGLWVQEELTSEVHGFIENALTPKGLAVVAKAEHMCMSMRGVNTPGVITTTNKMSGVFADHARTAKAEFLETIK